MLFGNVINKLHHVDGFAHTGATKKAHLAALCKRTDQVNHFDSCLQEVNRRRELGKLRGGLVNGATLVGWNGARLVNGATKNIHNAAQSLVTHGHTDGCCSVVHQHAATKAIGRAHGNGTNNPVTKLLLHLKG